MNQKVKNNKKNNSSNSLTFGRWPQTKIVEANAQIILLMGLFPGSLCGSWEFEFGSFCSMRIPNEIKYSYSSNLVQLFSDEALRACQPLDQNSPVLRLAKSNVGIWENLKRDFWISCFTKIWHSKHLFEVKICLIEWPSYRDAKITKLLVLLNYYAMICQSETNTWLQFQRCLMLKFGDFFNQLTRCISAAEFRS